MVGAGMVSHPSKWSFSDYNEIQKPRRKTVLIDVLFEAENEDIDLENTFFWDVKVEGGRATVND
jgi:hypothetical protein